MNSVGVLALMAMQVAPNGTVNTVEVVRTGTPVESVSLTLEGDVGPLCVATDASGNPQPVISIDLGSVTNTPVGTQTAAAEVVSLRYVCNAANGFTRVLASQNQGFLVREGSAGGPGNAIPYFVSGDGTAGLQFQSVQLVSPLTTSVGGSQQFLQGAPGNLSVRVAGVLQQAGQGLAPTTTIFAGNYSDTVTLAVTAN
ncbi:hypothetical protein ACPVPU_05055 [Sphingomonas sp. CJ99]